MPEHVYKFGLAPGEYPNYSSMALFLKTLQPEVNDIFLLSLIMVNVMCWFELVLARGNLFKRLGSLLWLVCKWNCLLILLCFPVLGMFQLPYMEIVLEAMLKLLRMLGTSFLASLIRADWLAYYTNNLPLLCMIVTGYASLVGLLYYRFRGPETEMNNLNNSSGIASVFRPNLNWDTYANFLFRPISGASPFGPSPRDYDLDAGMEMLIEQMSIPNIWLGPLISNDYLKELPVWKYTGPSIDSDIGSDYDSMTPRADSEGEEGLSSDCRSRPESPVPGSESDPETPAMFVCEKCRALQESKEELTEEQRAERAQAQIESESACAKYVMDSNYKCLCRHNSSNSHHHHDNGGGQHKAKRLASSKPSDPSRSKRRKSSLDEPAETYHPPPGMLPVVDCSICLDNLKYGVLLCGLPCKHSFHVDCIMHWLKQYNHLCPLCRWPAYKAKPCSLHEHTE